jgi:hypothetical protein
MNLKEANAVLEAAHEHGLSLGPESDPVSDAWYDAWRFVRRNQPNTLTIHSNLASPSGLLGWEREVCMPAAIEILATLVSCPEPVNPPGGFKADEE